ncbi:MAG: gamma-glutamyl-gamma-aminobutyrate hydrolase family protein [Anaerolineae bacterium]|nr:gamma-glutamyl-gamma-aminobutyrate hydrolase family protein [Anaerolineae bacterium]
MTQRRPIIGLTTYERDKEQNYGLPAEYIEAVRRAGGIPVLLPPGESYQDELLTLLDGVILTGGGDVDPTHYEGTTHEALEDIDPERDASEINLAKLIVALELPALSICRGAQVLNVALGGTLIEHLPDEVGGEVEHRTTPPGYTYHSVTIETGSRLAAVVGQAEVASNSWHHQAVRQLAPGLKTVAFAPDGTIEAVEMPNHPWLIAVQWHPESLAATDPAHQKIFDALVEAAARQAQQRRKFGENCKW